MGYIISQEELINKIVGIDNANEKQMYLFEKAYCLSEELHRGQLRKDKSPYFNHPLKIVLYMLNELKISNLEMICIALLHDVLEDTDMAYNGLRGIFGIPIAHKLNMLSKGKNILSDKRLLKEQYCKRICSAPRDVILIKLVDRIDNINSISFLDKNKQEEYMNETVRFYLPLAKRNSLPLYNVIKVLIFAFSKKNLAHVLT